MFRCRENLLAYLGHLVDVKELGKLDAEHVCGQSDDAPPSLTNLPEPGSSSTTEDYPDRVVKYRDPGPLSWTVWLPLQAASPALAPSASDTTTGPDPPPHWKHCRDTQNNACNEMPTEQEKP